MPACALSIYPQIYTRILFATKRKPNGQGEIRTHNVSSVTVLQTACFSHLHTGAYGGRPGRPPFSYVSTIAYGPGQICIIFKLTRHSYSCTPLSP